MNQSMVKLSLIKTLIILSLASCTDSNLTTLGDRYEKAVWQSIKTPAKSRCSQGKVYLFNWNIFASQSKESANEEILEQQPVPEVLTLQEIKEEHAKELAEKLGYQYYHRGNNAILSKYPIIKRGVSTVSDDKYRTFIYTDLQIKEQVLRVYCTHFSYKVSKAQPFIPEHRKQEALNLIKDAETHQGPVIISGDMNTLSGIEPLHEEEVNEALLEKGFLDAFAYNPATTHLLLGRLDWIYYKGLYLNKEVLGNYSFSDHRWLGAEFCLVNSNM